MKARAPLVSLLVLAGFLCQGWLVTPATAQIINEVYPQPQTDEDEWIEFFNPNDELIDLTGWQVWDQLASPSLLYQFETSSVLEPASFLVLFFKNVLNNAGDTVVLKDSQGQVIDTLTYSSSIKGLSWGRNLHDFSLITEGLPTPNAPNQASPPGPNTPSPPPALSEIVACPSDLVEWVELANPHNQIVSLAGFSLRDEKSEIVVFEHEAIAAHGFFTIEFRNILNNGGDVVMLKDPTGQIVEQFSYTTCTAAQSWVKNGEVWEQTTLITKNSANLFSSNQAETPHSSTTASSSATANTDTTHTNPEFLSTPSSRSDFSYPLAVLRPRLAYEKPQQRFDENIVFADPPRLERGALSVIMGSSFLLIPGALYVKYRNRQHAF